jgi:hypothetical protein
MLSAVMVMAEIHERVSSNVYVLKSMIVLRSWARRTSRLRHTKGAAFLLYAAVNAWMSSLRNARHAASPDTLSAIANEPFVAAFMEITRKGLGMTAVVDARVLPRPRMPRRCRGCCWRPSSPEP